jgi:hypothetical protein
VVCSAPIVLLRVHAIELLVVVGADGGLKLGDD